MTSSVRTWLALLVIPFLVGVVVHLLVPLEFILAGSPKIEESYNSFKIDVEQYTVRSMAMTNSRVVGNRLQLYKNIQNILVGHLSIAGRYDQIKTDSNSLNSAYRLANLDPK